MPTNLAEVLNEHCSCSTLNKEILSKRSSSENGNYGIERFYSETPSFINASEKKKIQEILSAIRNTIRLPKVKNLLLADCAEKDKNPDISGGVFLSLDFHIAKEGPKLIEINTNAGGAFLQLKLLEAQIGCCEAVHLALPNSETLKEIEEKFYASFLREWNDKGRTGTPNFIAIVDENPSDQFLYPEFLLFRDLFKSKGIYAEILDPRQIERIDDELYFGSGKIDLIYNRLTDFHLSESSNAFIRRAWERGNVVLTPNPLDYDVFARKTNLSVLSDNEFLLRAGLNRRDAEILKASVPVSQIVTPGNAEQLWENRKRIFFKPKEGFGSKAAYFGGKLTKNKFSEIVQGEYIGQEFIPPSKRITSVTGQETDLKMDVRAYIYRDEILLLASRLYQGQTTNFRTEGGGFSPLYVIPD
ncbi:circularly permuted ATPgrasp domain protein [Leptospira fluminis]|uniref:Circularly permuted ATPgrasp domain protein n=1 Tax=Leptospira fluminis TaxID=2484979 RepID=A0A4R9GTN0_9LEPT|nr:circularly permuted ATPgrasp domain protein [Leptospira fluminis]TGK21979.1 circularly permuted ATPgrasp domain protein [Leptospira fluminis]